MKRLIALILVAVLLLVPATALASDITTAKWYGIITASNDNEADKANLFTIFTLGTQDLIDAGFLSANVTDCAMEGSGVDTAFMPSVNATYPWCFYVNAIGENAYKSYILYTGGNVDMGGKIRYFPGAGGMTCSDNDTYLELGDNFTIEQKGWVPTDNWTVKNLTYKESAIRVYVSATENITAVIYGSIAETLRPEGVGAINQWLPSAGANWQCVDETPANNDTDYVEQPAEAWWRDSYATEDSTASGDIEKIVVYAKAAGRGAGNLLKVAIRTGGVYHNGDEEALPADNTYRYYEHTWTENPETVASWTWADIDALQIGVYGERIIGENYPRVTQVYVEVYAPIAITATNVGSGEHTVRVWADSANFSISIDSHTSGNWFDTTTLGGASVLDNGNGWTFFQNLETYWHYHKIWIGGTLRQHIEYEYNDTVFNDLSGYDQDTTPTFRTASSDADVSAVMASFSPIEEAQAPAWVLAVERDFWDPTDITTTGEFATTPAPTAAPGVDIIEAISAASGTPSQLPFTVISAFVILSISLTTTWFMSKYGSRNLWLKIIMIGICIAVCVAVDIYGFWMLLFFVIMATAVALFSRQRAT